MTFLAAAFCPHPPLLIPEVAAQEPVAVRAPAVDAVRWLITQPIQRLVVIGSGRQASCYPPGSAGSFAGYGVDRAVRLPGAADHALVLPLALAVGAWLLETAGWTGDTIGATCDASGALPELPGLSPDGGSERGPGGGLGLLVMGDGSSRRSEKAPGWLDDRSHAYDAAVSAALASGDPGRLAVDLALGAELLAAGAPSWIAAARLLGGRRWNGRVSYDDAPYGVGYLVATWSSTATP